MSINANTYGELFAKTVQIEAEYRRKASANVFPITDVDGVKMKGDSIAITGLTNIVPTAISDPWSTTTTAPTAAAKSVALNQWYEVNAGISTKEVAQVAPDMVAGVAKNVASEIIKLEDAYIYGLYANAGKTINPAASAVQITKDNILKFILDAKAALGDVNVDEMDMILEVSPKVDGLITAAMIETFGIPNTFALDGKTPMVLGLKKIVSSQIVTDGTDVYKCFVRTARSIAFYEQVSRIDIVDANVSGTGHGTKAFGDFLYGAAVVVPTELVVINCDLNPQ